MYHHNASYSIDGENSIDSFMSREQYHSSKLMNANEHLTHEAFNSMLPKTSKFEGGGSNEND
jgi:hypothetical protein